MSAETLNFSDPVFEKAMMLLEADYKVFFVEGISDQNLFLKLYGSSTSIWFAIPSKEPEKCGRQAVEEIVNQLQGSYPKSLFGICDRDFDTLLENPEKPKIFYTEYHDIVMDALQHSSFLNEYLENSVSIQKQKTQKFTKEAALRVSKEYALLIGSLRLLSIKEEMNLSFSSYKVKIPKQLNDDLSPNIQLILDGFLKSDEKNRVYLARAEELLAKVTECMEQNRENEFHLIQAHDLLKIFCVFFNKIQRGRRSNKTGVDFEDMILSGYHFEEFSNSRLCQTLSAVL